MAPTPHLSGQQARRPTALTDPLTGQTEQPRFSTTTTAVPNQVPVDHVTLTCRHCEVTWHGRQSEPCWSCGEPGLRPAGTTLIH